MQINSNFFAALVKLQCGGQITILSIQIMIMTKGGLHHRAQYAKNCNNSLRNTKYLPPPKKNGTFLGSDSCVYEVSLLFFVTNF